MKKQLLFDVIFLCSMLIFRNLDEAREIFGDDFDFKDMNFDETPAELEDEDEEDEEADLMEDEQDEDVEREPEYDSDGNVIEDVRRDESKIRFFIRFCLKKNRRN